MKCWELRAPIIWRVCRHNLTRVDEGRNSWNLLAMIMLARHEPYWGTIVVGREKRLLCDPGSELRLMYDGRKREKKGQYDEWLGRKKTRKKKRKTLFPLFFCTSVPGTWYQTRSFVSSTYHLHQVPGTRMSYIISYSILYIRVGLGVTSSQPREQHGIRMSTAVLIVVAHWYCMLILHTDIAYWYCILILHTDIASYGYFTSGSINVKS